MTSPTLFRKTLSKQQLKTNREQDILDLTTEDSQSTDTSVDSLEAIPTSFPQNTQKRKRLTDFPSPQKRRGKSIQWRPAETQQFQPHYPSNFLLNVAQTHGPHSQNYNTQTNTPNAFYQLTHQSLFPTSTLLQPLTPSNTWYNPSSQITTSRSNPFQHPIQNNPNNPADKESVAKAPDKFKIISNWKVFPEALETYLMQLLGSGRVPLSYIICLDAVVTPDAAYATEQARLVALAPLNGSSYQPDNARVYGIIKQLVLEGPGRTFIMRYDTSADGQGAWLALRAHYDGGI